MTSKDWYQALGVASSATGAEVATAVERLSRQAAALANTAPERSQQLREQVRAMKRDLLSGDEARRSYDLARSQPAATPAPVADPRAAPVAPVPPTGRPSAQASPQASAPAVLPAARRPAGNRLRQFLQQGWTCSVCGEGALPGNKFCPRCGGPISSPSEQAAAAAAAPRLACRACGAALRLGMQFCTGCGAPHDG